MLDHTLQKIVKDMLSLQ